MSDVLGIPVTTLSTAGEGGAWGVASLARRFYARVDEMRLFEFTPLRNHGGHGIMTPEIQKDPLGNRGVFGSRGRNGTFPRR